MQEEKEKQAAEEALKSTNTSLGSQVRSLEERVEKSDTEHVQVRKVIPCGPMLCADI